MIYIDTDCAMGSSQGDVDDGFAIAAVLESGKEVRAIGSVFGNTSSEAAAENVRALVERCSWSGPILLGARARALESDASRYLEGLGEPVRALAIGPLTNVAAALQRGAPIEQVILVGGNATSNGRWPPVWPFEFNLTHDREAAITVFRADVRRVVIPLDVAQRLRVGPERLDALEGELGSYLSCSSRRWCSRSRWVRASSSFPVWDLVAAMYTTDPMLFDVRDTGCTIHPNAWVDFSSGSQRVELVADYDPDAVWAEFVRRVNSRAYGESHEPNHHSVPA